MGAGLARFSARRALGRGRPGRRPPSITAAPLFSTAARHPRAPFFKNAWSARNRNRFVLPRPLSEEVRRSPVWGLSGGQGVAWGGPPYDRPAAGSLSSPRCGTPSGHLRRRAADPRRQGASPRRAAVRIPTGSLSEKRSCPRCLAQTSPPSGGGCPARPRCSRGAEHTGLREDSLVYLSGFCPEHKSNASSTLAVRKN